MKISPVRLFALKFKQKTGFFVSLIGVIEIVLGKLSVLSNESGEIRRFIAINAIKDTETLIAGMRMPEIEVFSPSTLKDLNVLKHSIISCLATSINPISQISIAVPSNEKDQFENELNSLAGIEIQILDESTMISQELSGRIRKTFGLRSGWVIAEFLKLNFVTQSKYPGVLVLDSDTILLSPQLWLDEEGRQSIFPVQERQSGYFELLSKLEVDMESIEYSFMSHYMLMQPDIYREMYRAMANLEPEILLEKIILNRDPESKSPFCICFEAYSHFGLANFGDRFKFSKWSNIGIKRELFLEDPELAIKFFREANMKSLSVHAYL